MAYLTKQKVKEIIQNAPEGTTPKGIVSELRKRGHELEGYKTTAPIEPVEKTRRVLGEKPKEKPKTGIIEKVAGVGEFLGMGALGRGLGLTAFKYSKEGKELEKKVEEGTATQEEYAAYGEIYGEAPTGRQIVGSGAETALTAGTLGVGTLGKTLFKKAVVGAGLGAGFAGTRQLQEEEKITPGGLVVGAGLGAGVPIVGKGMSLTSRFFGNTLKRFGGALSGKGTELIDTIIKRPETAKIGLRGESNKILLQMANTSRDTAQKLNREANKVYGEALKELPKTDKLSIVGIKSKLTNSLRKVGVMVDEKKKKLDFFESPLRSSEEKILKDVFGVINKWKDTSPMGLNRLAIKVGNYRKAGEQSNLLNSLVMGLKKNIRNYIGDEIPAVKNLNTEYAKRMDFIDAISQELSVKGAFNSRSGTIKTARKIEQLFNANKELTRELVEELEGKAGIDILGREAGRQLQIATTRASASIGDLARNMMQSVIPPKAIGEIAVQIGTNQQKIRPIIKTLQKLKPIERTALFKFIGQISKSF